MPPRSLSADRKRLLQTVGDLRVADLELLTALLVRTADPGRRAFGAWGVRRACESMLERGLLHRLWKHRDPKFRINRGSARQVFLLSAQGAHDAGLPQKTQRRSEEWFEYLKDPRKEYVLEHELMIARFHGALLVAHDLQEWSQGLGTEINKHGVRIRPDAFFQVDGRYFFLEADTGNERVESGDPNRRTIVKKIRRYGEADAKEVVQEQFDVPGFSVIFMVPRRPDPRFRSGREESVWSAIHQAGRLKEHGRFFYRVITEDAVVSALNRRQPLPVFSNPATLMVPAGGSSSLPLQEVPPTHEAM